MGESGTARGIVAEACSAPVQWARACLTAHEGNHIISDAMTTIAR